MEPVSPARPAPAWRAHTSPEAIAGVLAVLVLVVWLLPRPATSAPGVGVEPSPATTPAATPAPPPVDLSSVEYLATVNDRLLAAQGRLESLVATQPFPAAEAVEEIRGVRSLARQALSAIPRLRLLPGAEELAERLDAAYSGIRSAATVDAFVNDVPAYRRAAETLVERLAVVPSLQATLSAFALEVRGGAMATSTPTGSPPTAASPPASSPVASPIASASPASPPVGTSPTPTAGPRPGEQLENGGFETGGVAPWQLRSESGAVAEATVQGDTWAEGARAAQVVVTTTTTSRAGVSLQQSGVDVVAGGRYELRVSLAASVPVELRLRVASSTDATYGARLVAVGPDWVTVTMAFSAPVSDADAIVAIDFGRASGTVWLDGASFAEASAVVLDPTPAPGGP